MPLVSANSHSTGPSCGAGPGISRSGSSSALWSGRLGVAIRTTRVPSSAEISFVRGGSVRSGERV